MVEFNYPSPEVFCIARPFEYLCSFVQDNEEPPYTLASIRVALDLYYNTSGSIACFDWSGTQAIIPGACQAKYSGNFSVIKVDC